MPEHAVQVAPSSVLVEENKRLKRAVEELSILNDLARAIGASLNTEEIMQTIIRRSLRAVNGEQGVITLVEGPANQPMKTLIRTMISSSDSPAFHLHQALLGWMHLNKKPLHVDDPGNDTRFRGVPWDSNIRTVLCVPLMVKSELRGVLTVYNKKDGTSFNSDDQRLLAIIAAQSAQVIETARLYEEEKAYAKMQQEVEFASRIQRDLLPQRAPSLPGYDIAAHSVPAQSVGGDYYDFIDLDPRKLGLCLGDVSGKGLPASLLMANLQATLRGQALLAERPQQCLERSNKLLYHSTSPEKFATLFYGVLDGESHTVHYSNAGHDPPILLSTDGGVQRLETGGVMLGVFDDFAYEDNVVSIAPGDVLVVYSDGVVEAMNREMEQYGEDRFRKLILENRDAPAQVLIEKIITDVRTYADGHPQSDDITVLVARRVS